MKRPSKFKFPVMFYNKYLDTIYVAYPDGHVEFYGAYSKGWIESMSSLAEVSSHSDRFEYIGEIK